MSAAIQDTFLNQVRKDKTPVVVHLLNGFQIRGLVRGFDSFTIVIDSDGKQIVAYKHALSTITPASPVSFMPEAE